MKKRYSAPQLFICFIDVTQDLLITSMKIGEEKVNDSSDIGFVKEERNDLNDFWGTPTW